jgi:glycosyltransferase involved in cell wall biosynthesis
MIIHFTTVHPRDDSRMRDKELASLQSAFGAPVALYVQDGLGNEVDRRAGFPIVDTGPQLRRLARMTVGGWRMFNALRRARPTVAQFHDPELLPWAIPLALWGVKVVYDVHEDVPRQVKHNGRLPSWARTLASPIAALAEWIGARLMAGIAAATPVIAARFPPGKTVLVRNFPLLDEMHRPDATPLRDRPPTFAYIGTINQNRNIFRMIEAVGQVRNPSARLRLAGRFVSAADRSVAEKMPAWSRVKYDDWLSRDEITIALAECRAGLLLLKPVPHEMVTLPIKLFEYMAAGIPIISSDFPVWREIIEDAGCGLLVDPENTDSIVAAMEWILDHPAEAEAMGERGRRAAAEKYSWDAEAATLVDFYRERLGVRPKGKA